MSTEFTNISLAGAFAALGVSLCCVMPMALIVLGLGGSWAAVFSSIAAVGYYVAGLSALLLIVGWVLAIRRRAPTRGRMLLGAGTLISVLAWMILLNEVALNERLISLM